MASENNPGPGQRGISRRRVMQRLALGAAGGALFPGWLPGHPGHGNPGNHPAEVRHPHLFFTEVPAPGVLALRDIQHFIKYSLMHRESWARILARAEAERKLAPYDARSLVPKRPVVQAKLENLDYFLCFGIGQRMLRHALVALVLQEERFKQAALEQARVIIDPDRFPDWIDQAHRRFKHPADLRTGMLSQDLGLVYDWLHPMLSEAERGEIVEGLARRGIRPFLTSMEQDPWWAHDMNNWYSVIIGGLGVCGMALGDDHQDARLLVDLAVPKMRAYLSIYGGEGEFNESVAYSGATRIPVQFFHAFYYHRGWAGNPLAETPFPETGEWTMRLTLPPGLYALLGDGAVGREAMVEYMAAIASATQDPVMQGFVQRHLEASDNPYVFLWLDGDLGTRSPEGRLSLGKVYKDNGGHFVSRSSWDPVAPVSIVYGKAKRDHNHGHNDVGQVCIDTYGRRMITDLGAPSSYPPDFFDEGRYFYYNASARGHNVLMFDSREPRHPPQDRGVKDLVGWESYNGRFLQSTFSDDLGGFWKMDLSRAYDWVIRVKRTVVHLLPGIVVVLDEARLPSPQSISLRWHTIKPAEPDSQGVFIVQDENAILSCRMVVRDPIGDPLFSMKRHAYEPPYDLDRQGEPLEPRREPYVEALLTSGHCRIISLFSAGQAEGPVPLWKDSDAGSWEIETAWGLHRVTDAEGKLVVACLDIPKRRWEVML